MRIDQHHPAVGKAVMRVVETLFDSRDHVLQQRLQFGVIDVRVRVDVRHFGVDETGERIEGEGVQRKRVGVIVLRPNRAVPSERGGRPEQEQQILNRQEVAHLLSRDRKQIVAPAFDHLPQFGGFVALNLQRIGGVEILHHQAMLCGGAERQQHDQMIAPGHVRALFRELCAGRVTLVPVRVRLVDDLPGAVDPRQRENLDERKFAPASVFLDDRGRRLPHLVHRHQTRPVFAVLVEWLLCLHLKVFVEVQVPALSRKEALRRTIALSHGRCGTEARRCRSWRLRI